MEVGDLFTVIIVMMNCPPGNTAPLNGPAAVSIVRVILEVHVYICYRVYKVFFAASRSLDGISRYLSVNFLILLFFC